MPYNRDPKKSCQPCGCDEGAGWVCERHEMEKLNGAQMGLPHASGTANVALVDGAERIVTDPLSGGQKGQKLERFDLIPVEFERALARHYGKGAEKYEDRNWEKGYKWSLSMAALRRHLAAWLSGESRDPETGTNHLIAVAWHCVALYIFELRKLGTDDIRRKEGV